MDASPEAREASRQGQVLFRCFGFSVVLWIIVLVWWVALFSGLLYCFWEVLCVLRDLRVEILGGLRNGMKVYGGV